MSKNLGKLYLSDVKKSLSRWGSWEPTTKYALGDIGLLINDNEFDIQGKYLELDSNQKLSIESELAADVIEAISYSSSEGTSLKFGVKAELDPNLPSTPKGKSEAKLEFDKEGAFYFVINNCCTYRIKNMHSLEQQVLDLYAKKVWDKNWVIVTQIMQAEKGSFYISQSKKSSMTFAIEGDLKTQVIDFGDASANFSLSSQTGKILILKDGTNFTPMFKLAKLKLNWFDGDKDSFSTIFGVDGVEEPIDLLTPEYLQEYPEIREKLKLKEFI